MGKMKKSKFPVSVSLFCPDDRTHVGLGRFQTIEAAERFVAAHGENNPEALHRGDYSIDAPEMLLNG